jgi:hypothetical protein
MANMSSWNDLGCESAVMMVAAKRSDYGVGSLLNVKMIGKLP